jgi:uncharacterized protein (DUF2336 family)
VKGADYDRNLCSVAAIISIGVPVLKERESLLAELEDAVQGSSRDKRVETLRRITNLFLAGANRFNDEQITLFDDVLMQLIDRIEAKALYELSEQLAPVAAAPVEVIRSLARHDEIIVAGPVLAHSSQLATSDLVEIAEAKSQAHLLAISGRAHLDESVTDVLTGRGNQEVVHKLVNNAGARFSEAGLATLNKRAQDDESLVEFLGRRLDIPLEFFRKLLLRATEAARSRLLSSFNLERQAEIRLVLAKISKSAQDAISRDYAEAQRSVQSMQRARKLNENAVLLFALSNRYEHVVAALTLMCPAPCELIDHLMRGDRIDALLVPCKAAGLEWPTVRAILKMKSADHPILDLVLEQSRIDYTKLSMAAAGRVLRFWQVHEKTSG